MPNEYEEMSTNNKEMDNVFSLFKKLLKQYKEKDPTLSDEDWMANVYKTELNIDEETAREDAKEANDSIKCVEESLKECNEAAKKGISKEKWLADKISFVTSAFATQETVEYLQNIDSYIQTQNEALATLVTRKTDGAINMNKNLDGNIAEQMLASTAQLSANLQKKDITVHVRKANTLNSVDVRVKNNTTGQWQNYQMKFGEDAKATIKLIEKGDYRNQRIVVPAKQLKDVQEHFAKKGVKTITDHIDAWGAKGKSFTKEEMKALQLKAQEHGNVPELNYNSFNNVDLAKSIGKNTARTAAMSIAISTGLTIVTKMTRGETIDKDELVEEAIKTGKDSALKSVLTSTIHVGAKKGILKFIPKNVMPGTIGNVVVVAVENVKILYKLAKGELSITEAIDEMGRVTCASVGGIVSFGVGYAKGAALTIGIPVIGPALSVVTGFIGGMIASTAGSYVGEKIHEGAKKVRNTIKKVATNVANKVKGTFEKVKDKVNGLKDLIFA